MALLSLQTGKLPKKSFKLWMARKFQAHLEHHNVFINWTGHHMEVVSLEPKQQMAVAVAAAAAAEGCLLVPVWEWMRCLVVEAAVNLALHNHPVEEEIIKFMLEILMLVLQIQCFFMSSSYTTHQFMKPKSYAIQFLEKARAMVLLNLEIKKRVNAPFKKCPENLLAVDKLKWIMQVKETEMHKINLHHRIDSNLKEDMVKTQWMVVWDHKDLDYQVDTELNHQWEHQIHTLHHRLGIQDHLHQEWWEVIQAPEIIWITEAECHPMVKECMDKVDHHQVIMEWKEEATVEWAAWEWEVKIHIYNQIINMVDLIMANMVVPL